MLVGYIHTHERDIHTFTIAGYMKTENMLCITKEAGKRGRAMRVEPWHLQIVLAGFVVGWQTLWYSTSVLTRAILPGSARWHGGSAAHEPHSFRQGFRFPCPFLNVYVCVCVNLLIARFGA